MSRYKEYIREMKEDISPPEKHEGYILMLDLLGFKNRIHDDMSDAYTTWYILSDMIEHSAWQVRSGHDLQAKTFFFSDTAIVCFYREENDNCDEEGLLDAIVDVVQSFFTPFMSELKAYFRGALAYGEFKYDEEKNIVVGDPLVEAAEHHEKADMFGVILAPSAEKQLAKFLELDSDYVDPEGFIYYDFYYLLKYFVRYKVPSKDAKYNKSYYTIDWIRDKHMFDRHDPDIYKVLMPEEGLHASVKEKYYNTMNYVSFVLNQNKVCSPDLMKRLYLFRDLIETINKTRMQKSYKMGLLLSFVKGNSIKRRVSLDELARDFQKTYTQEPFLQDLTELSNKDMQNWSLKKMISFIKKNPIAHLEPPFFLYEGFFELRLEDCYFEDADYAHRMRTIIRNRVAEYFK